VLCEVTEDHVATVTLSRPHALNAFNKLMIDETTRPGGGELHCQVGNGAVARSEILR
jgi:hypothetical protein